jgi:predicted lipoprotein with Yx(FWY)xxD motif
MRLISTLGAASAALILAACGGGSGGYMAPSSSLATPATSGNTNPTTMTLPTASLLGSPGFIDATGRTTYVLSNDTVTNQACTVASGCTALWPPIAPPGGAALSSGFTSFQRADNGAMQLAFNNHPLYLYAGDTAAGQVNGNGIVSFGGTWTVTRP